MLKIFDLTGKHAIVTGATGLLGQKHCEAIMMAGGCPILTDINDERLETRSAHLYSQFGIKPPWFNMNVSDESSIRTVRDSLHARDIFPSILINNAANNPAVSQAGLSRSNRLEQFDKQSFLDDMMVGLVGAISCAKIFGSDMADRGSGVIINISSDLGVIAPDQRLYQRPEVPDLQQDVKPVSYSVVKHGIIGLTKYLATYWADKGVRCNSLSPGGVLNGQNPQFVEKISKLIPVGRMAQPTEYQGALVFLCSDASSYMNGSNLIIDGGRSVW